MSLTTTDKNGIVMHADGVEVELLQKILDTLKNIETNTKV